MQKILKKIHAVMEDVSYIQKDAKNAHHGYSYASELAIKKALGEAFRKHKVVFQLETLGATVDPVSKATVLQTKYSFYDVESGEQLSGDFVSFGPSRDDKGGWAATTNAIKYILTSMFLIPTGDDAENDKNHPPPDTGNPSAKKTTKKPKETITPPTPKQEFSLALDNACKKLKLTKPIKMANAVFLFESLCKVSGVQEIATEKGYNMPTTLAEMSKLPEHTGWLVLTELIGRMGEQLELYTIEANQYQPPTEDDNEWI